MINKEYFGQLKQDIFALQTAHNKTYIEIGAWNPVKYSNTYLLEKNSWRGFSLELDTVKKPLWEESDRTNKIYWQDALTFDYKKALEENNLPKHIGYLSVDIEPPQNTFDALKRVIEQGITADCVTFEHDKYRNDIDFDPIVTNFLRDYGYKVAVHDVYRTRKERVKGQKKKNILKCPMETWFVKDNINFETIAYDDWLEGIINEK